MTWQASNSVYIFSFLTGKWRRGSDIPGPARAFFGCDSDRVRTVFVAGGHDREKKALRSCLAYDVVDDKWVSLADMAKERDECQVIFLRGRVHVIGGYCTEEQGRFGRSAEVFNAATWEWDPVEEYLDNAVCPRNMVAASDGAVYMCRSGEVAERVKDVWQFVTGLPADVAKTEYVAEWEGKLLVIGSAVEGDAKKKKKNVYVVDLKKPAEWRQLGTPTECSGVVHCGCCVEI
ncbi:F-box/kelch-repeat protein At1g80440 [Linum grandiflorum]